MAAFGRRAFVAGGLVAGGLAQPPGAHAQALSAQTWRLRDYDESGQLIVEEERTPARTVAVARVAGIQAAKKCSDLIPLCHPLMLTSVSVDFRTDVEQSCVHIEACCKVSGKTGVEMEALTAVSVAALTIYDMCKAVDRGMEIRSVGLLQKTGGKSGSWQRPEPGGASC